MTAIAGAPGRLAAFKEAIRRPETRWAYLFLTPWLFGFVVFTAGPMLYSLFMSFTNMGLGATYKMVGTANYERMLRDPNVGLALSNTAIYAAISVPLHIIVALGLAMVLLRVGRAAGFFRTVFYLPTITPLVAAGTLWLFLLNGQVGLVNRLLDVVGIQGPNWTTDSSWVKPGLVLLHLWTIGGTVVIYFAALRNVPLELYEAARMDGASAWQQFRGITLPYISGAIFFTLIVNTIAALQTFDQAYAMFFGSQVGSAGERAGLFYAIYLFRQAFENFRLGYAAALAWLLFVIVMVITFIQIRLSKRWVFYEGE